MNFCVYRRRERSKNISFICVCDVIYIYIFMVCIYIIGLFEVVVKIIIIVNMVFLCEFFGVDEVWGYVLGN